MRDPYLYPDSEVLRNLADIHDVDMLKIWKQTIAPSGFRK